MNGFAKGLATFGVTAAVLAAFAAASIYAAGGLRALEGGASTQAASAPAPARATSAAGPTRETVGAWRVEESDDSFQDDPRYRVVRLEHRQGGRRFEYVAQFSPWSPERWTASYSGSASGAGGSCSAAGGGVAPAGWPAPAERLQVVRGLVAARIADLERDCGLREGEAAPLLDGFDAAFAALSARHARWQAEVEASGPPEKHIG